MNFNIWKGFQQKKNHTNVFIYQGQTISNVIKSVTLEELESTVIQNFNKILDCSQTDEIHYFTMYKSWKKLFIQNSPKILNRINCYYDILEILENFPELEADVYHFLFDAYLNSTLDERLKRQLDILDDILYPMVYMERSAGIKIFPEIYEKLEELLDVVDTYDDFYGIISFYETEVNIPIDKLSRIVTMFINEDFENWIEGRKSINDFDSLTGIFRSCEAYTLFMDNLPKLLHIYGIELYSYLIQILGPLPELRAFEHCCYEFDEV